MSGRLLDTIFTLSLLLAFGLAGWGLAHVTRFTDPAIPANVALALGCIFVLAGVLICLLSWGVTRRAWGHDRKGMALRHGLWGGLFVVALPLLRWLDALSLLAIGAVLLILVGIESLILLQQEYGDERTREPERTAPSAR